MAASRPGKAAAAAGGPAGAYFPHAFLAVLIAASLVTSSSARLETLHGSLEQSFRPGWLAERPGKHGRRWERREWRTRTKSAGKRFGWPLRSPVSSGLAQDAAAYAAEQGAHSDACGELPCNGTSSSGGAPTNPRSRCCRCYSKDVTWSASGACTKCAGSLGGTLAIWDVPAGCRFHDKKDRKKLVSSEDQREDCSVKCEETQPASSRSQCCLCKNKDVTWSGSGACNKCEGGVKDAIMMWDPPDGCHYERPADKKYLMHKDLGEERRQTCSDDCAKARPEGDGAGDSAGDSVSLCCLCKGEEETITWSASGSCSDCANLGYRTRWQVSEGCNHYNPEDKSAIESSEAVRQECADKCILDQPSAGQSQCCLCKNGDISWSASGTCNKCSELGGSERQWKVEEGCRYHNSEDRAVLESDPKQRDSCQTSCEGNDPEAQSSKTKTKGKKKRGKKRKRSA